MPAPPYRESMLAKIIRWGMDREEAGNRFARALRETRIEGIGTALPFHRILISHPGFRTGIVPTRLVHGGLGT